jgi:hypothetical protein
MKKNLLLALVILTFLSCGKLSNIGASEIIEQEEIIITDRMDTTSVDTSEVVWPEITYVETKKEWPVGVPIKDVWDSIDAGIWVAPEHR